MTPEEDALNAISELIKWLEIQIMTRQDSIRALEAEIKMLIRLGDGLVGVRADITSASSV